MHRLARTGAVLAATAGLFSVSTGAALAHYCYKVDTHTNKTANGQAWMSIEEVSEQLDLIQTQLDAMGYTDGNDEMTDVREFLAAQEPTWRLMGPGLLAGGTEGTDRTPEQFGYSGEVIFPLFRCLPAPPE